MAVVAVRDRLAPHFFGRPSAHTSYSAPGRAAFVCPGLGNSTGDKMIFHSVWRAEDDTPTSDGIYQALGAFRAQSGQSSSQSHFLGALAVDLTQKGNGEMMPALGTG